MLPKYIQFLDVPKITSPPLSSYDLVSGTPAQIHCEFKSTGITIKWEITTKDKQKTTIAGTSGVYSLSQGNLTISSVPSNLEGANLTCIGENAFGSAQASTTIRMVYGTYINPPVSCITLCFMISRIFMEDCNGMANSRHFKSFLTQFCADQYSFYRTCLTLLTCYGCLS